MTNENLHFLLLIFLLSMLLCLPIIFIYIVKSEKKKWLKYFLYSFSSLNILIFFILLLTVETKPEKCESIGGCWNKDMKICATEENGLPCNGKVCE